MKTVSRKLSRLLSLALVFLLALTAVVPVFAANNGANTENLKITIHNNTGLPEMTEKQFGVYQLFKGTPNREGDPAKDADWDASEWNNWTLANIQWGASIKDEGAQLLAALKNLNVETYTWAGSTNPFESVASAADVAKVLSDHTDNKFMQGFADLVMKNGGLEDLKLTGTLGVDTEKNQTLTYDLSEKGTGYYIFQDKSSPATSEVVSEYIVAVMGTQDIDLKASLPQIDKQIVDGANGTTEGDVAGVSDYVQFKLTGTLPKNFEDFDNYEYIFHDTLSAGLTYVEKDTEHPLTVTVYADSTKAASGTDGTELTVNTDYTVVMPGSEEADDAKCSIEVAFADLMELTSAKLTHDSVIVVTYYAQVNENAVIGSAGNPNSVLLEYSNDPHDEGTGKTKEEKVYVFAFGLDLTKIGSDADHGAGKGLPGAGFVLKKGDNYGIFEDGKLTGWTSNESKPSTSEVTELIEAYKTAKADFDKAPNADRASEPEEGSAFTALKNAKAALSKYLLESGDDGHLPDITGLDEGDYALHEVIVPDGYNPMDDFELNIEADINADTGMLEKVVYTHGGKTTTYLGSTGAYESTELGDETVPEADRAGRVERFKSGLLPDTIVNQKAPFLPFTGGIGTLIFYALGIALIAGAVTYLVIASKKRKKAEENA